MMFERDVRQVWRCASFALLAGCSGLLPTQPTPVGSETAVTVPTDGGGSTTVVVPSCSDPSLPDQAEAVIGSRCSGCHGPDSEEYGGFGDALDPVAMIDDGWVVPGNASQSKLAVVVSPGPAGETPKMPTADGGGPLAPLEIGIVQQWIDCGAEDWTDNGLAEGSRGLITTEMVFSAALADTLTLPIDDQTGPDQPHARYLSLVPLYDAGVSADRIRLYGEALNKLVWHLTTERTVPRLAPVALDGVRLADGSVVEVADGLDDELLFRIDEREIGWEGDGVDVWEELMKAYPYGVSYQGQFDAGRDLVALTRTRIPIANGDWFARHASLPPLYEDVLDIPSTIDAFYEQFGGISDIAADFDQDRVDCAGMDGQQTLVSNFNRVICRHDSLQGYCWESFDFAAQVGQKNVFASPTDFFAARDGGEAFCSLANGAQVYLVYDAAGNRLEAAPINVVIDYNPDSGGVVKPGLHCMRCHESGIIERDDQVLDAVTANEEVFDADVVDQVLEWFPENSDWPELYGDDLDQFQAFLDDAGVDLGEEPTWALSQDHEAPATQARVAAELGIAPALLEGALSTDNALQLQYASLFNGTTEVIDRVLFESLARDTICSLEIGDPCDATQFCGESAAPCPEGSVCTARGECTTVD